MVSGWLQELVMVLAVALTGLLLAGLVALTPWYARDAGAAVVEMSPGETSPAGGR